MTESEILQQRILELQHAIMDASIIAITNSDIDGSHHKVWIIDQMLRKLLGDDYDKVISDDDWDCGIAP